MSVIVPCRDASNFIALQLAALKAQQGAPTFEILLCDNGGNEDLGAAGAGPNIRVVDATHVRGTAYARNRGIEEARADRLLFCDADDVVGPTWVRDGFAVLHEVEAFSGGAVPMPVELHGLELAAVWDLLSAHLPKYELDASDYPLGTYPILLGCSFGMRRDLALRVGGLDGRFRAQAEDNDLAFRIQRELGVVPRAAHVAVAYRTRPSAEITFRRAFKAGYRHAAVCALHNASNLSPSFAGHWILRPLRSVVLESRASRETVDTLARLFGLLTGRLRYSVAPARSPKMSLVNADERHLEGTRDRHAA